MTSASPTQPRGRIALVVILLLLSSTVWASPSQADDGLAVATRLWQHGKYAEAEDAFRSLDNADAASVAVGIARCQESTGAREKAEQTLADAIEKSPKVAALPAELARLALMRGDGSRAATLAAAALELDPTQSLATWLLAEMACRAGRLDEANRLYERLVNDYNGGELKDPERLRWVGLAAAQFARWNRLSDQFGFLVNEFYPDLVALDGSAWQAHYETGRLFAEKYNQSDAGKAFKAALVINPNAAEVHAAVGALALDEFEVKSAQAAADRAIEINPQCLAAWHLKADIHLANFEPRQAIGVLEDARRLDPTSEETLGRLAAAYGSVDGLTRTDAESRLGKLVDEVTCRNAHPGRFYESLGDALDRLRRWPDAARYYQLAIDRMPQLVGPRGKLGMMLMRLGDERRAKQALDESFEVDPFNVRVNNTLKVLEVLDGYDTLETEHFEIKYDPAHDKLLAPYLGQWLEEVYPQLVRQMGFAPPEKSLFEVFSQAKNTDGHGWFSARMVGLPHIHPIGACAGKIVALQSPIDGPQRFNWARVLKHEFIHVVNLQQTGFNIPHWFTEGLAVMNEGYPRPQAWNDLLAENLANGKLFNLETINLGFIRPHSSTEWTLAYCQAQLYAEYMLERFGADAIAKMLAAYADNLTTAEALRRSFDVSQADFETGYRGHVEKIVAALPKTAREREMPLDEVRKQLAKKPNDPELLARLALDQLNRKNYSEARRQADASLAAEPKQQLANYVRARLHMLVGENREALERLESTLDRQRPQENLLSLLAGLKLKSEDYAAAGELYALGREHDPQSTRWLKSLAAVYLKSNDPRLPEVLTELAGLDPDDFAVRKKLAQLFAIAKRPDAVLRWTREALHIDVRDPAIHQWRAEALLARSLAASMARSLLRG